MLVMLDRGLPILALNDPIPAAPLRKPWLVFVPGGVPIVTAVGPQLSGLDSYSWSRERLVATRGNSVAKPVGSVSSCKGENENVPSTELATVSVLAMDERTLELFLCG